jgi:hypothetical protein
MAVVGYASRRAAARAAKERREKWILGVGLLLLIGLLVFEGPKTLARFRGATSAPAPAATSTAISTAGLAAAQPEVTTRDQAPVAAFPSKDPFVAQVRDDSRKVEVPAPITGPPVRAQRFVAKDPFVQQVTVDGVAPGHAVAGSGPVADVKGTFIVVLASIPAGLGRTAALRAAATARKAGVDGVGVLSSTRYATLRSGFYVVYMGPFSSLDDTLAAVTTARSQGFVTSYSRQLGR